MTQGALSQVHTRITVRMAREGYVTIMKEITMRKIVAGLFISLDGVVEAPNTWHFPYFNEEMGAVVAAQMEAADTLLLGRRTYEEFAGFWPNQSNDDPFAAKMNNTRKVVVSTIVRVSPWLRFSLLCYES